MKAIESDFLKVIKQRAEFLNSEDWLATELAGRVERFTKWLLSVREMQTRMSIPDLYAYWLREVEGKK